MSTPIFYTQKQHFNYKSGDFMNNFLKKIVHDAVMNTDIFTEEITYNGQKIQAVVEIGENEVSTSPGIMKRSGTAVISGSGFFTLSLADVPDPKRQDQIIYNGKKYNVAGIELLDSMSGTVTVKVTSEERGYFGR